MKRRTEAEAVAVADWYEAAVRASRGLLGGNGLPSPDDWKRGVSPLDYARDAYIAGRIEVEDFERRVGQALGLPA